MDAGVGSVGKNQQTYNQGLGFHMFFTEPGPSENGLKMTLDSGLLTSLMTYFRN